MQPTSNHNHAAGDLELAQWIFDSMKEHRVASMRRVRIEAMAEAIVLRGEVHSFYAKQILQHSARRVAGDSQVIDEISVVTPAAFRDPLRLRRTAAAGVALLVIALVSGCGSSQDARKPVFPVTGQVTFNGRPAAGASVVFHPKGGPAGFPAPRAQVDVQGNFVLTTYQTQDGAPAGEYAVTVVLEKAVKKGDDFERGPNVLPPKYSKPQTTAIVARVAEGPNTVPIKLVR